MNKVSTLALSVAMALGVAACSPQQSDTQTTQQQQQQLTSGLNLADFNKEVRPQDDLFNYVNGTWYEQAEIPADKARMGSFLELREENQERLHKIITAAANSNAAKGTNEQKIGDFYNSFMNVAELNELGYQPIADDLAKIKNLSSHAELAAEMASLARVGVRAPFGFYVYPDAKNPDINAIYFSQSGLGLPDRDYYLEDNEKFAEIREQYQAYISEILALVDYEAAADAGQAVLDLETKLAEVQWSRVESRNADKTYNKKSVADIKTLLGGFDFGAYSDAASLQAVEEAVVRQPSYFAALGELFADVDLATWKHYVTLKTVERYASVLSEDINDARFAFYGKVLRGTPEQEPRWKRGVTLTDRALGEILGQEYVETYFPPVAKARMEELVENLIEAYGASILELEWMTPDTKEKALEKLSKFTPYIGYPSKWRDYSDLSVDAHDLVANVRASSAFDYAENIGKIGKPVDEEDWGMTPQTVNAYYSPVRNEIVFPAGILQPPFFDMNAEDAVNYGGIGAVIGHELGHGFDDQGSKYDGDGNLRSWWTDADREAFDERGSLLAKQYDSYEVLPDVFVNGKLTLGENIGDLAGLTIAYRAYLDALDGKKSPVMDGYTGEQRVFLGWAQVWKTKVRDEYLRNQVLSDPHSPAKLRVNGTVVNIPAFYEAFDVKEGDALYVPEDQRVTIW